MNLSIALLTIRWMMRDTFRQAASSGLLWLLLAVTATTILFCLSVSVTGQEPPPLPPGETWEYLPPTDRQVIGKTPEQLREEHVIVIEQRYLNLGFGLVPPIPITRTAQREIVLIQVLLAISVADVMGVLLALVWTAGFLPTFLDPSVVTVLLAKPVPRWALLAGKFLGVLIFLTLHALLFIGGTWMALGIRTGIWSPLYLLAIPILVLHFAIFFSFSTLLAVMTRSTVAVVIGTLMFWVMCWGMNIGHHAFLAFNWGREPMRIVSLAGGVNPPAGIPATLPLPQVAFHGDYASRPLGQSTVGTGSLVELGYWVVPKPADMGILLMQALESEQTSGVDLAEVPRLAVARGDFQPLLSVLSSLLFMLLILALAGYEFVHLEY